MRLNEPTSQHTFAVQTWSNSTYVKRGKFFQLLKGDEWIPVVVFGRLDSLWLCQFMTDNYDFHELISLPLYSRLIDLQTFNHPRFGLVILTLTEDNIVCVFSVAYVDGRFDIELLQQEVLEFGDTAAPFQILVDPHARALFIIDRQLKNVQCWLPVTDPVVLFRHEQQISRHFASYRYDILINCCEFMYTSLLVDSTKLVLVLQVEKMFSGQPSGLYMFEFTSDVSLTMENVYMVDLTLALPKIGFLVSLKQCPDSILCICEQSSAFVLTRSSIIALSKTDLSQDALSNDSLVFEMTNNIPIKPISNNPFLDGVIVDIMKHECYVEDIETDKIEVLYYVASNGNLYQLEANFSTDFEFKLLKRLDMVPDTMFALSDNAETPDIFVGSAFGDSIVCGRGVAGYLWEVKGILESSYPFLSPTAMHHSSKHDRSVCGISKRSESSTCIKEVQQSINTSVLSYTDPGSFPAVNGMWVCDTAFYGKIIIISFVDETVALKITDDYIIENVTTGSLSNSQYLSQSFRAPLHVPICSSGKTLYAGTVSSGALIQVMQNSVLNIFSGVSIGYDTFLNNPCEVISNATIRGDHVLLVTSSNRLLLLHIQNGAMTPKGEFLDMDGVAALTLANLSLNNSFFIIIGTHSRHLRIFTAEFETKADLPVDGMIESIVSIDSSIFIGTRNGLFIQLEVLIDAGGRISVSERYRRDFDSAVPVTLSEVKAETESASKFMVKSKSLLMASIDSSGHADLSSLSVPKEFDDKAMTFSCTLHSMSICVYDDGTLALLRIKEDGITVRELFDIPGSHRKALFDASRNRYITHRWNVGDNSINIFDSTNYRQIAHFDLLDTEIVTDMCFFGELYVFSISQQGQSDKGHLIFAHSEHPVTTCRISFSYQIQCICPIDKNSLVMGSGKSLDLVRLTSAGILPEYVTTVAKYQMRWPISKIKYEIQNNILVVGSKKDGITLFRIIKGPGHEECRLEFLRSEKRSSVVKDIHIMNPRIVLVLDVIGNIYGLDLESKELERCFNAYFDDTLIGLCSHLDGLIAPSIMGRLVSIKILPNETDATMFRGIEAAMENSRDKHLQKHRWARHGINRHGLNQQHLSFNVIDCDFISQFVNCGSSAGQTQIISEARRHFDSAYHGSERVSWDLADIQKRFSKITY